MNAQWRIVFGIPHREATVFYEAGLKLKSDLLPLTIIHQPRFTLTLLLCKCPYHISRTGWAEGAVLNSNAGGGQPGSAAGSSPLTNTHIIATITALYCVGKITNVFSIPSVPWISIWCENRWRSHVELATRFFPVTRARCCKTGNNHCAAVHTQSVSCAWILI